MTDIVSLLNLQARARHNALRSLRTMQLRRAEREDAEVAVADAEARFESSSLPDGARL